MLRRAALAGLMSAGVALAGMPTPLALATSHNVGYAV